MKKTYIKPLTEAREMETESMLCGSGTYNTAIDKTNSISTSESILSKRHSGTDLWADDEE